MLTVQEQTDAAGSQDLNLVDHKILSAWSRIDSVTQPAETVDMELNANTTFTFDVVDVLEFRNDGKSSPTFSFSFGRTQCLHLAVSTV